MTEIEDRTQRIILHSQSDCIDFPQNTNTYFKNRLQSGFKNTNGFLPQIQLLGIYSNVDLHSIQIELAGIKSYFFDSIHNGRHKRLHIGSGLVKKHEYCEVKNSSFFDVDLRNLECWALCLRDEEGNRILPKTNGETIIELGVKMKPSIEAPKYLYFGDSSLKFPTFLKIRPKCFASLADFSHKSLANVFPPHNQILVKYKCTSDNDITCRQGKIEIPSDFYSLDNLVQCLNSKMIHYGVKFEAEEGKLKFAKDGGQDIQLVLAKSFARLIGCLQEEEGDFLSIDINSRLGLFDPFSSIPRVLALKCCLVADNSLNRIQKCLRLIYPNPKNPRCASYEFEYKQPCLLTPGYVDSVTLSLVAFPDSSPIYFSHTPENNFSGCIEIQHCE